MKRFLRYAPFALLAATAIPALVLNAARAEEEPQGTGLKQDAAWLNEQQAALAALKAEDGWSWMEGGLMWRRVKGDGSGEHPTVRDVVRLHYRGTLTDGTEFDSSYASGRPATFPLRGLIPAWQMAVPQMGVGDTIELAVPADLGYGPRGGGPIPGGATLFFTIELLDIVGR